MTAKDVLALPTSEVGLDLWLFDGQLVERWNGNVFHTPAHAAVVANISAILGRWCGRDSAYRGFGPGCPYLLARNPDTLVTFDASVVKRASLHAIRTPDEYLDVIPLLAVEVVELDEEHDLLARLVETSHRHGVNTVWVIDPFEDIVIVHRRGIAPLYANGGMKVPGGDDLPGFACPVAEIFE